MNVCSWSSCGMCGRCESGGDGNDDEPVTCLDCDGSGEVQREDGSDQVVAATCLECGGKGWVE